MSTVVEWLDSTEGQEWLDRGSITVRAGLFGLCRDGVFSASNVFIPAPDPAYDPCGAPPLAPERVS